MKEKIIGQFFEGAVDDEVDKRYQGMSSKMNRLCRHSGMMSYFTFVE